MIQDWIIYLGIGIPWAIGIGHLLGPTIRRITWWIGYLRS